MKIEKINENKIKITITVTDLKEHNIDLDALNYSTPQAQDFFWDLMEQAHAEYGFDPGDSQVYVEAMPLSPDGFVIVVSKMEDGAEFESIHKYIKDKFKKSDLRTRKKGRKLASALSIYAFASFENLLALTERIASVFNGESALYLYRETYYLVMVRQPTAGMDSKTFDNALLEYCDRVANAAFYEGYLNEHGQKLIDYNAIQTLHSQFLVNR